MTMNNRTHKKLTSLYMSHTP